MMTEIKTSGLFKLVLLVFVVLQFSSCEDPWADHYYSVPEKVNMKLWDALKEEDRYASFVQYLEEHSLDTLLKDDLSYTLFIPSDSALKSIPDTITNIEEILRYHILESLFIGDNQFKEKQLLTMLGKYVIFDPGVGSGSSSFDEIPIIKSSPLYLDGRFYELKDLAFPRPNLYEYVAQNNSFMKGYIDSKDSIYMDKELSTPVAFDELGNTVFDTVFGLVNTFEYKYFPISEEHRSKRATFILFTQEQLDEGMDEMAGNINLTSGADIPDRWKSEVLMPALLKSAILKDELEYTDLMKDTLTTINDQTVVFDHTLVDPGSRYGCSNGVAFLYNHLTIPDSLYLGRLKIEGESLVDSVGLSYQWKDELNLPGETNGLPSSIVSAYGSGGKVLSVRLASDLSFSVEFKIKNVLPMPYRFLWRGNASYAGNFQIYINDEPIGEEVFDSFDFFQKKIWSVKDGIIFRKDQGNYNSKDFWVNRIYRAF
jgi:hypothetical protein